MISSVSSVLIKNIRNSWKRYRSHPYKAPDKTVVEICFLRQFIKADCLRVNDDGIGEIHVSTYGRAASYTCHCFTFTGDDSIDGPTGESLRFYYFDGGGLYNGSNYGLIIQDAEENVIYWREAGQNPRTEWLINCLAGDLENGNEGVIFDGEPVTI